MRKWWIRSLALSLGLVATGARAEEGVWRAPQRPAAQHNSPPPAALAKPVAIATSKPAPQTTPAAPAAPAVTLGRPQAIARTPGRDEGVRPASFTPTRDPLTPVVRGLAPDTVAPRPMPAGPTSEVAALPAPGYSQWRRGDEVVASTVSRSGSESVAAPPVPGPTLQVAPTPLPAPMGPTTPPPGAVIPPSGFGGPAANNAPLASNGPPIAPVPAGPFPPPVVISGPGAYGKPVPGAPFPTCDGPGCASPFQGRPACGGGWGCGCCDGPRLTLGVEALVWWMTGDKTPPLVNAAPPGVPLASTAFTNVIAGGETYGTQTFTGLRGRALYWFTSAHCWGIDGSAFFLAEQQNNFFAQSDGVTSPQLGRPFFNLTAGSTNIGAPLSEVIAGANGPEFAIGNVSVQHRTSLWGFDANLRRNLWCGQMWQGDLFFGYRQLGLQDDLTITENLVVTRNTSTTGNVPGTAFSIHDQFSTSNRFYGGQIGLAQSLRFGDWSVNLRSSVALGCTQQTIDISGSTAQTLPGAATTTVGGGLLAQNGTNIGRFTRKFFGVVPEAGLTLGWDAYDWLRLSVGYNFLYWNNVARAGEQIDNGVNLSFAPNPPVPAQQGARRPMPLMTSSDLFVHGVTVGIEFRY